MISDKVETVIYFVDHIITELQILVDKYELGFLVHFLHEEEGVIFEHL